MLPLSDRNPDVYVGKWLPPFLRPVFTLVGYFSQGALLFHSGISRWELAFISTLSSCCSEGGRLKARKIHKIQRNRNIFCKRMTGQLSDTLSFPNLHLVTHFQAIYTLNSENTLMLRENKAFGTHGNNFHWFQWELYKINQEQYLMTYS